MKKVSREESFAVSFMPRIFYIFQGKILMIQSSFTFSERITFDGFFKFHIFMRVNICICREIEEFNFKISLIKVFLWSVLPFGEFLLFNLEKQTNLIT